MLFKKNQTNNQQKEKKPSSVKPEKTVKMCVWHMCLLSMVEFEHS